MAQHQPVDIDPHQAEQATRLWHHFTQWTKWSIVGIVVTLILMAIFLLP
jgi:uncharacterized membrane protein